MEKKEMMYDLVSEGDLQGLKTLVEQHTKDEVELMVTPTDDDRTTPLTLACHRGHVDIVEYLIDVCGADIEQLGWVDSDEFFADVSPVWCAVAEGHLNVVQLLHTRGANMHGEAEASEFNCLIVACENGDLPMVKFLLENGADIEAVDFDGANGLMCACYAGRCEVASYLIQKGVDVNRRTKNGTTALVFAIIAARLSCMKLLLRHGAELDNIWFKLSPLLMIRGTEDPNMVEFVINLPFSTRSAKIEALESLGAKYVNIEIDQQGDLASRRASSDVDGEAVDGQHKVDNIAWSHRTTLVDMERLGNEAEETRVDALLITKPIADCQMPVGSCFVGCKAGKIARGNCYELWLFAVEMQRKAAVPATQLIKACLPRLEMMLCCTVAKDKPVEFEVIMAVFVVAVHEIETEMCRTMTERIYPHLDEILSIIMHLMFVMFEVSPTWSATQIQSFHEVVHKVVGLNPRDSSGRTPLHLVCLETEEYVPPIFELVKSLLEHGADPEAIDDHRDSPLHVLAMSRPVKYDLINLLLSKGAHFDAQNSDGKCLNDLLTESERFDPFDYVTLKCLAAASVVKNSISFKCGDVPQTLVDFVALH